jgi:hypothetical protein
MGRAVWCCQVTFRLQLRRSREVGSDARCRLIRPSPGSSRLVRGYWAPPSVVSGLAAALPAVRRPNVLVAELREADRATTSADLLRVGHSRTRDDVEPVVGGPYPAFGGTGSVVTAHLDRLAQRASAAGRHCRQR